MAIDTVQKLQAALQQAIKVELTTIPAYLYATYSIPDDDATANGYIFGVAVEEMLHMSLAANLLIAVGGQPKFYDPAIVPSYPCLLPHHAVVTDAVFVPDLGKMLIINLAKCDLANVQTFLWIEQPETSGAPPESDNYDTIGQFYAALGDAFNDLDKPPGSLFANNDVDKQLTSTSAYPSDNPPPNVSPDSGALVAVSDLASATLAMNYIVNQGEGISQAQYDDPRKQEFSHYYKFLLIHDDLISGKPSMFGTQGVINAVSNPTASSFGEKLGGLATLFNACYSYLLLTIENMYATTEASQKANLVSNGLNVIMKYILTPIAMLLMQQPIGESSDQYAGPTFQYYDFKASGDTPQNQLKTLYSQVVQNYPSLDEGYNPVGDQINGLPSVTLS